MYSIIFFVFFTLSLIASHATDGKYFCTTNHVVKMESDQLVFFETPSFPQDMPKNEMKQCYITFSKRFSTEEKNKRFVMFLSDFSCVFNCNSTAFYYATNLTTYFFYLNEDTFHDSFPFIHPSFQGIAYFDDWNDDCPLESVSRVKPFEFTDDTQIVTIRSTYDPTKPRKQSCLWQFKAPENYGFKIVITNLNILNTTIFKVENSHDTIITPANVRIQYPRYIVDKYLKIYLSENDKSYFPMDENNHIVPEFTAYVTIIKDFFNDKPIDCDVQVDEYSIVWSYWNKFGYPSNAKCNYTLTIFPNTEVIANSRAGFFEYNVDMINYYYDKSSIPNTDGQLGDDPLVFATNGNEERNVTWEFISDGSIQLQGFKVKFEIRKCFCANPLVIVDCISEKRYSLMNDSSLDYFYCGNMKYPYCKSRFISIQLKKDEVDKSYNVFRVISNNTTLADINYRTWNEDFYFDDFYVRMPSKNLNILQVITASSTNKRHTSFFVYALNISKTLPTVILNEEKSYYIHDQCKYKNNAPYVLPIKVSPSLVSFLYFNIFKKIKRLHERKNKSNLQVNENTIGKCEEFETDVTVRDNTLSNIITFRATTSDLENPSERSFFNNVTQFESSKYNCSYTFPNFPSDSGYYQCTGNTSSPTSTCGFSQHVQGEFYLSIDSYENKVHYEMQVGEIIAYDNGIQMNNVNIPYTKANPCLKKAGIVPFKNATYQSSFCCTKFSAPNETNPVSLATPCSNDTTKAWLDIILVVEVGSAMSVENLKNVSETLITLMKSFTISQNGNHTARVALITFATNVTRQFEFTNISNYDELKLALSKLPSYSQPNDAGVSIKDALQAADNLIYNYRKSFRVPAVLYIGAGFDEKGYMYPPTIPRLITLSFAPDNTTAQQVINYSLNHNHELSFNSTTPNLLPKLLNAFTQVNCICPKNTYQFSDKDVLKFDSVIYYGDCFYASTTPAIPSLELCSPGILATIDSEKKFDDIFYLVINEFYDVKNFTIGVHKSSSDEKWKWWNYDKSEFPLGDYPEMYKTPQPNDNYGYMSRYYGYNWRLETGNNISLPYLCQMRAYDASNFGDRNAF